MKALGLRKTTGWMDAVLGLGERKAEVFHREKKVKCSSYL